MRDDRNFALGDLARQMANMIRVGVVQSVDTATAGASVKIGELVTDTLPWLTARAGSDRSWWAPSTGEQVVVLSPFGDFAQGIILPALYQSAHAPPASQANKALIIMKDGAQFEYDHNANRLKITLPAGAKTDLVSDGGIAFVGDLNVSGNITASEDITDHTRSMQGDRDIYNDHKHTETGGTTLKTSQTM